MKDLTIGNIRYRLVADQRGGQWVARAEREDTGERHGGEATATTEAEAVERLASWLQWQDEHSAALAALQDAERSYHRTIAGSAFANPIEGPTAIELQKEALEALKAARVHLDDVRARKPAE
jgi:hypothetical protein